MNPVRHYAARSWRIPLGFLLVASLGGCAFRAGPGYPPLTHSQKEALRERIDGLVEATDPDVTFGMKALSLKTGEVFYEKNATHRFTPASNMKLLTAAAALDILGPYFRFRTALYADSAFARGTPPGNIYLKGAGDPALTDRDLAKMVSDLELLEIHAVEGDIIVDATEFDADLLGPGWMWDQGPEWYAAPVSAMTLNDNCVAVWIAPGKGVGDPPRVRIDPPTGYVSVNVEATTVDEQGAESPPLKITRRWKTGENIIDITGTVWTGTAPESRLIAVENPPLYAGTVLKELLLAAGIRFHGTVRMDTVPSDTVLLTAHGSPPLSETVKDLLKYSDNLTAELLVKKMGSTAAGSPGSWPSGLRTVKTFLHDEAGLDTATFVMADGSGFSRYNLLSPDHLVQLLEWVHGNFKIFPEFLASLPIGGGDGSLAARMTAEEVRDRARAKTGTLQGISSLSGYLVTRDNETVAFSIMMNGYIGDSSPYRGLQDDIVSVLTSFSRF